MKRLLVVGSGSGGTLTANLLAREMRSEIRRGEVSVDLVGKSADHVFQPGYLDVAFKGHSPRGLVKPEGTLLLKDVSFRNEAATKIDLEERSVTLAGGDRMGYDYLVMATGAFADPRSMPGLQEASFNFHTGVEDSSRTWEALRRFKGGKVVIAIAGVPHKCPPSPNEAAFMVDEYFRKKGTRDKVELSFVTPYPRPYPAETLSKVVAPLFEKRGISVVTLFNAESVDPAARKMYSLEGDSVDYDLLIAVPPHHGTDVIRDSGFGDEDGWIPADKETMRVKGHDDAYAIGDATDIPISKSGVVAHLQSGIVAQNIALALGGSSECLHYNGRINCPMEMGRHRAIFVSASYTSPAADQTPSMVKYVMKRSFSRMYWRTMNGSIEWLMGLYFGKTSTRVVGGNAPEGPALATVPAG
jgi:sulfide:quinone oxidoreductase